MNLLSLNVGIHNVSQVNNCVLLYLSRHTADRLPSKSTLANMFLEARSVAYLQIGEQTSKEDYTTCTLMQQPSLERSTVHFKYQQEILHIHYVWLT